MAKTSGYYIVVKNIVIFGSYNGISIGDTAILLGLLSSLERLYGNTINVNVLVSREFDLTADAKAIGLQVLPQTTTWNKKRKWPANSIFRILRWSKKKFFQLPPIDAKQIENVLANADYLIIGGGNLVMDLFPVWPKIMLEAIRVANKLQVPYCLLGVGASPVNNSESKSALRHCLNGATHVYFRDKGSQRFCEEILNIAGSRVMPDLAFGIMPGKKSIGNQRAGKALVNVASVFGRRWPVKKPGKFHSYITGMAHLVKQICKECGIHTIYLYNTNLNDNQGVNCFKEFFDCREGNFKLLTVQSNKVSDMLDLTRSAEVAIVTRLHAGLIAALGGCKVVAVAYHPKVKDVLGKTSTAWRIIDIDNLIAMKNEWEADNNRQNSFRETYQLNKDTIDRVVSSILGS